MTRYEALEEARSRWPESENHNAYETIEELDGVRRWQFHVICYRPFRAGRGDTFEAAFADAATVQP